MRKAIAGFALAFSMSLAGTAYAEPLDVAPPGYPWVSCSAPHDCAGPSYVRRVFSARTHRTTTRHVDIVRHARRHVTRVRPVHLTRAVRTAHRAYLNHRPFEYIYDPRLAAAVAWADIVNADALFARSEVVRDAVVHRRTIKRRVILHSRG